MYLLMLLPLLFQLSGSSPVTGPKAVRGQERGCLAVQCRYTPGWESHGKWWCRGADWSSCKILVQTTASEPEVKRDRVSIRDNRENRTFTVTTEELRLDDAGVYWCGIARVGTDHGDQVTVTVDPGTAHCHDGPEWENYVKGSCRDAAWKSCIVLVQTTGSKPEETKPRAYINRNKHVFTPTTLDPRDNF
uniref:CD300 molecule like family member f n=1 Tax=Sus scrofa TaxID=9823 RepID=A0A4X1SI37_PIG